MRELIFRHARVNVFADHVDTIFEDGAISSFWPFAPRSEEGIKVFLDAAKEMGYVNPMQYGIEHDITHAFAVDAIHDMARDIPRWAWRGVSGVVWAQAHPGFELKQQDRDDEEHVINRLQKYLNTGEVDNDWGVLEDLFGYNLPRVGQVMWRLLRAE